MSRYVDGFVIPIKKSKLQTYKKMATLGRKIWMKHGALDYYECVGDDLKIQGIFPFTKLAKIKSGETVIFAFIVFKSKAHRNQVNKRVMKDPSMHGDATKEFGKVIDMKRFSYGGFKTIVHA